MRRLEKKQNRRTERNRMKIRKKIKPRHIIFGLIMISIISLYFILENERYYESPQSEICQIDSDCVTSSCCHPTSCINSDYQPDCENIFCTQECTGPIDCGKGECRCIENRCETIKLGWLDCICRWTNIKNQIDKLNK